ncbi:cytochrome P450 [Bradyrhizobium sp. CCBAU 21360]|uniref:cytochrome P450 n=1 Tax=Bradyrhizobium sp. CCBAU 21360 TaxID=1325081 RepID=UPI002305FCD1|nr:cytochrome P450 [Bradyrhizobium sp. CCBAU 21360]
MNASSIPPSSSQWSMLSLANVDPFPSYDELRKRGPIVWDPGMNCWLSLSYDTCKVIESDESTYRIVPADLPEWMIAIRGGKAGLSTQIGEGHARMRRLYLKLFGAAAMPQYRNEHVLPVINYNIDRFAHQGRAELFSQLAELIPIRVIFSLCGLPWKDDDFVERMLETNKDIIAWIGMAHSGDELTRKAKLSSDETNKILLPYVLERRGGRGSDLISQIWARAPDDYGEVGPDEVLAITRDAIGAAGHTTMHGLTNSIYLFLSDPALREAVTRDQEGALNALVEEALRTLGSPQWRFRKANREVSLGGVTIKKDDLICLLHAAANRDPEHYTCPHAVDLKRKRVNDHLAFNVGPRLCAGMPLARLEIRECLKVLISRFPNLRLDPSKESPRFVGFSHRSFSPLHVLF